MAEPCLLVGDIGGTNARFALASPDTTAYRQLQTLRCADFDTADLAIKHYLTSIGASRPEVICLAAAGPVVQQQVQLTNNSWRLAGSELSSHFSISAVRILNDFEAIAYSIPFLGEADCLAIGQPAPGPLDKNEYMVGILGPGTGLGAVGLKKLGETLIPITGEASHCGFAPESQLQIEILGIMRRRFGRVSAERLVSGSGLENIYRSLSELYSLDKPAVAAPEIFAAAQGEDSLASETVSLFFEMFGQIAGDLALTLGAEDGIFIGGGIVQRYPTQFAGSGFRTGFENKGRHRGLMERIPTQIIMHPQPGILGASYCAAKLYHQL